MKEEKQELIPDFTERNERLNRAVTELGLALGDALKPLSQAINNLSKDPKFKAMLAALPEPEPEEEQEGEDNPLTICPDLLNHATEFNFGNNGLHNNLKIIARPGSHGNQWIVFFMDGVWSREAQDFVWEPQPSSRTDEFIRDTRFTLSEALQIVGDLKK